MNLFVDKFWSKIKKVLWALESGINSRIGVHDERNLKVTCSTFPVESPEDVTTVSTWKRSSSSSKLFRVHATRSCTGFLSCKPSTSISPQYTSSFIFMATFHHFWRPASSIGRDFSSKPIIIFSLRKQPEVVEIRRAWILELLEFLARYECCRNIDMMMISVQPAAPKQPSRLHKLLVWSGRDWRHELRRFLWQVK